LHFVQAPLGPIGLSGFAALGIGSQGLWAGLQIQAGILSWVVPGPWWRRGVQEGIGWVYWTEAGVGRFRCCAGG